MLSESDLRGMLHGEPSGTTPRIDLGAVMRRSARRHHGQQVAVGALSTLAVVGIGAAGVAGIRSFPTPATSSGSAASSADNAPHSESAAPFSGGKRAPADRINLCGGPLADVAPAASGLVLAVDFPATASASAPSITGQVTMTNTGTERLIGTTAASPAITLSQNGTVLWHSNGATVMMVAAVDLAPGASMSYPATFTPVRCSVDDDLAEAFPADLPSVGAGSYGVSAAIDFGRTDAAGTFLSNDLVTGPVAPITLQ
ncbi:hypothetical protein [Lacisediminihabitans changchengi]|uniref:Uncharacterized protein n=1 Tax=Lacisediminihabitans changchengi TaxID=2787634 RepID=A0A934SIT8_9MICO|nr:hypothetical protein [Lacisediminihabitans changchengi]MBK4347467.1 hypothetical protein [Lacisediminihabitans changchengi]